MTETSAATLFYDSAVWPQRPPGHAYGAKYIDGIYEPEQRRINFSNTRWITVTGDYRRAGIIDWEPGNPCFTPAALRGFVRGRRAANQRARVYCDRSHAAEAIRALQDFGHGDLAEYDGLCWWVSTLNGQPPTATGLSWALETTWNARIPADKLWACQFAGGPTAPYDTSVLYGEW